AHLAPECLSQFRDFFERFAQAFGVAGHSTFVPKKKAKFAMDGIERMFSIDIEHFLDPHVHVGLCFVKFWRIVWWPFAHLTGELIRSGLRQNEIAIGQTLHNRAGAEPCRAVIGRMWLGVYKQAGIVT